MGNLLKQAQHMQRELDRVREELRGAELEDVYARAEFTRHGRRVANVRVFAWQSDPKRPVAVDTAHFLLVPD